MFYHLISSRALHLALDFKVPDLTRLPNYPIRLSGVLPIPRGLHNVGDVVTSARQAAGRAFAYKIPTEQLLTMIIRCVVNLVAAVMAYRYIR